MAINKRIKDPSKIPVQLNVKIPFDFRDYLYSVADREQISITEVVEKALMDKYGRDFTHELAQAPK